jgi:hypothetical protein
MLFYFLCDDKVCCLIMNIQRKLPHFYFSRAPQTLPNYNGFQNLKVINFMLSRSVKN